MKNLKFSLLAVALLAGIGSAVAFTTASPCAQVALVKVSNETFQGQGTLAADQIKGNYLQITTGYDCALDPKVCTFYEDSEGAIRQCEPGLFSE